MQAPQPPGPRGLLRVRPALALLGTLVLVLVLVLVLGVALSVVADGAQAQARTAVAPSEDADRVRVGVVGADGPLAFPAMAPGIGATREVTVAADGDRPVSVRLGVGRVVSRDNGCVRPELRAGDVTCRGAGELLPWLAVRVDRVGDGVDVPLYAGSLAGLAASDPA